MAPLLHTPGALRRCPSGCRDRSHLGVFPGVVEGSNLFDWIAQFGVLFAGFISICEAITESVHVGVDVDFLSPRRLTDVETGTLGIQNPTELRFE